jgi:caa(3)-type oxidase subunit IV
MAEHAHPPPHAEHTEHAEHAAHEHPSYWKVYFLLLGLLCVSVAGPMFGIKVVTIITAFGVAAYKAYLVAKNFMHVNVEKPFVTYLLLTVVVFMLLFFAGAAPDVMKRQGTRWEKPAWVQAHAEALAHPPEAHPEHESAPH